jgi:biotin carboxyl carrier protein
VPAGLGPAPGVAPHPAGRDDRAGVRAPTAGLVVAVYVQAGDAVAAGQPVVALEAMKIEQSVPAPRAGRVRAVRCAVGDTVAAGALLVELADEP